MLDISGALKSPGTVFPFEQSFDFEPTDFIGEELNFSDAKIKGEFFGTGEGVSIKGTLSVTVHAHCAKCLEPVVYHINTVAEADFSRSASDSDVFPIVGHQIDVQPAAYEAMMLEMPFRFLCSSTCRGLCPVCGKNRNLDLCTCQKGSEKKSPFAALNGLVIEQDNEEV